MAASFFETGAMATPTKSRNSTILGQGVPPSTQWSHPKGQLISKANFKLFI